jgi:hypothetical protein
VAQFCAQRSDESLKLLGPPRRCRNDLDGLHSDSLEPIGASAQSWPARFTLLGRPCSHPGYGGGLSGAEFSHLYAARRVSRKSPVPARAPRQLLCSCPVRATWHGAVGSVLQ